MENKNLKFGVSNFRVFDKMSEFEFAPITFLTGPNSSGKSSIMKAQEVLSENFEGRNIPMRLYFDNKSKLSSIQDVLNNKADNLTFHLELKEFYLSKNYNSNIKLIYDNGEKFNQKKYLDSLLPEDEKEKFLNSIAEQENLKKGLIEGGMNQEDLDYHFLTTEEGTYNDYSDLVGIDVTIANKSIIQIRLNYFSEGWGQKSENPILDVKNCKINFKLLKEIFSKRIKNTLSKNESKKNDLEETFKKIIESNTKKLLDILNHNPKLLIFNLKNDDKILENIISVDLFELLEKLENRVFNHNYNAEFIFSQDSIEFTEKHIKHLREIASEYLLLRQDEIDSEIVIETFLDYIFYIYEFEINYILKNEYYSSYTVELSSFGQYIKDSLNNQLNNQISDVIRQIQQIEPVPILKNITENSIFSTKEKSNSFIHQMVKNFDNFHEGNFKLNSSLMDGYLIKKWMSKEKFGIGTNIEIDKWNNFIELSIIDFNNRKTKINNLGFGVGQIFSLLLIPFGFIKENLYWDKFSEYELNFKLAESEKSTKTFYLEEPESNLHPKWQSLLVELLLELHQEFGYRFIIETHSEYMIRKAQYLVAKDQKCQQDFKIYYFNGPNINESEKKFFEIKINKNGMLDNDFGPGFFDESTNLTLDLLRINSLN